MTGSTATAAARWSGYTRKIETAAADLEPSTNEFALAINYYLNGHANKLTLDAAYFDPSADGTAGGGYYDMYPGVPLGFNANEPAYLIRFQWQLAL